MFFITCKLTLLTHLALVQHICVSEKGQHLCRKWLGAIIWTNADLLSTGPLGTNINEIQIKTQNFPFMKMHLKMPAKWPPFCPGRDEFINCLNLCIIVFYVISPEWNSTDSCYPSWRKTSTYLPYTVNTMATDALATPGARASAATILTSLLWIIQTLHTRS